MSPKCTHQYSMFLSSSYFPKMLTCFFQISLCFLYYYSLQRHPLKSPNEAIHPSTVHFLPIFINKLCLKYSGYHCWNILYFTRSATGISSLRNLVLPITFLKLQTPSSDPISTVCFKIQIQLPSPCLSQSSSQD